MKTLGKNNKDITINLQWGFHMSSAPQTCHLNDISHVIYILGIIGHIICILYMEKKEK